MRFNEDDYEFIQLVSFKVEMKPSPQTGEAEAVYTETQTRDWIGIVPPEMPETAGIPPDEFLSYIATCMEPIDLALGSIIYEIMRDDQLRQRTALRLCDSLTAIMLADGIVQTHKQKGKTDVAYVMERLLEGGGLGCAGEIIRTLHEARPLDTASRIRTGVAIMRGIVQILLVERGIRSRSLVEVHTYSLMRGLLGQQGIEKMMAREIPVGILVPKEVLPAAKPEPIPEEIAKAMEVYEFRQSHPEVTDEMMAQIEHDEGERMKREERIKPKWEEALKQHNERINAEQELASPPAEVQV